MHLLFMKHLVLYLLAAGIPTSTDTSPNKDTNDDVLPRVFGSLFHFMQHPYFNAESYVTRHGVAAKLISQIIQIQVIFRTWAGSAVVATPKY